MVTIRPFKGIIYDWHEVEGGPEVVTSPPYDVITPKQAERMKKSSAHNVTNLTLPDPALGKPPESRYAEAARILKSWRKEGVLRRRPNPGFYLYRITYDAGGERRTATGFAGLLRLDRDYEEVRGHERTHKGPIEDRLDLLRATRVDLEPIQFLYNDPEGGVLRSLEAQAPAEPWLDFVDPSGTRHTLWIVEAVETLEAVQAFFEDRRVYIADGHHRYATALHYAEERRRADDAADGEEVRDDGLPPFEFKLSVFMEAGDAGLTVHPTHRLVMGLEDPAAARKRVAELFAVQRIRVEGDAATRAQHLLAAARRAGDEHRFVFYWGDGEADVVSIARDAVPADALPDRSAAWRALDVSVLHHHVLPGTLRVDESNAGDRLRYTRVPLEVVEGVDGGGYQVAVVMNPTPLAAVTEVADARESMPQKSTYFQPKLQSGLFFSPL